MTDAQAIEWEHRLHLIGCPKRRSAVSKLRPLVRAWPKDKDGQLLWPEGPSWLGG